MNNFKQYYMTFRRWIWLLLLCAIIGAGVGYYYSSSQTKIYQSSVNVLVMLAPDEPRSDYAFTSDQQLAVTYTQMIKSAPILETVGERVGGSVLDERIQASMVDKTQLLHIIVEDPDPQRAAIIADTLVDVFIEYNTKLQAGRFAESEESLQSQISQLDAQIVALESNMRVTSISDLEQNINNAESELERLQTNILTLQEDIYQLNLQSTELLTPIPTPFPTPEVNQSTNIPIPTAIPTPSSIYTISELRTMISKKDMELAQIQRLYDLYQQIYTNLVVLGNMGSDTINETSSAQMEATMLIYRQIKAELLSSYENIRLSRLRSTSNIVSYEPANIPTKPIRPQVPRDSILGGIIGLFFSGFIVFLIEYFDNTFRTADEVDRLLHLPVIGYIGHTNRSIPYVDKYPRSPTAEAFRTLRTNLEYATNGHPLKTFLITSAHPADGKTTVAVNLACTQAQGGKNVLLVDGDLRRPHIHEILKISNSVGLSNLFRDTNLSLIDIVKIWKYENFGVITAGKIPPNPADLLASNKMASILDISKQTADVVIIDVPPFLVADASILSSRVDGVILVIRPGKTPMDAIKATLEQLHRAKANIVGVVFSRIPKNRINYYSPSYHKKGYPYYDPHEKKKKGNTMGISSSMGSWMGF